MKNYIVYRIINLINNRIYIGSSSNFEARKAEHFGQLRNGRHPNIFLQNDYKIYGRDSFVMEIIKDGFISRQAMLLAEYELILKLPVGNYNIDKNCPVEGMPKVKKKDRKKMWAAQMKWKLEKSKPRRVHRLKDHPLLDSIAQRKKEREELKRKLSE